MVDEFDAVDVYLSERFHIGLEQILVDASVDRLAAELVGTVEIACQETGCFQCSDGGKVYHYEGAVTVATSTYQYKVWIYEECCGARCMTDLREFVMMDWPEHSSASGGWYARLLPRRPLYSVAS